VNIPKIIAAFFLIGYLALIGSSVAVGGRRLPQDVKEVYKKESIPTNFKTWSLFLVCNPKWLGADKSQDLKDLYKAFEAFGTTIGPDNAAVWFWKQRQDQQDTFFANLDVERSSKFCSAFKLTPSKGPFVIVTSTYPDESHLSNGLPANSAVFELGEMQPSQISDLLAQLVDELVKGEKISAKTTPASKQEAGTWIRLMEAVQHTLNSFGCAWTFKVEAEGVQAQLHACKG
jgi:hypothetical protein